MKDHLAQPWDYPRCCLYCKATFQPRRPQDAEQKFCSPNHRKAYFKGGKFADRVRQAVRAEVAEELDEIKRRLRLLEKFLDASGKHVVTLEHSDTHETTI